jgi:uncharacterized protein (TIGR02284 family)
MADYKNAVDVLQDLVQTCKDGEDGYLHAASQASDPELQHFFREQSIERGRFAVQLKQLIEEMGAQPPAISGTFAATLHRAWFELKGDLGGGDQTLLNSVERGEDAAKQSYEQALEMGLPQNAAASVRLQAESVIAAHDQVRNMRDAGKQRAA